MNIRLIVPEMATAIRFRRRLRRSAIGASLAAASAGMVLGAPSVANAQIARGVVFQHGIWSNSQTWQQESNNLAALYVIYPFTPSTSSKDYFSTQAAQLASQVTSAGGDAVLVAHSNGGLVGRLANVPSYQNRSWGGLVTVGSPHGGAQLMASVTNGNVGNWLFGVLGHVADAVDYYANVFASHNLNDPLEIAAAIAYQQAVINLVGDALSDLATLWFNASNPVSVDMVPGSNILANVLNTQSNLGREASAIPVRVGDYVDSLEQ